MVIEDTKRDKEPVDMPVRDIPTGQVFTATAVKARRSCNDLGGTRIFLRTYTNFTMLDDPEKTWGFDSDVQFANYIPRDAKVVLL